MVGFDLDVASLTSEKTSLLTTWNSLHDAIVSPGSASMHDERSWLVGWLVGFGRKRVFMNGLVEVLGPKRVNPERGLGCSLVRLLSFLGL